MEDLAVEVCWNNGAFYKVYFRYNFDFRYYLPITQIFRYYFNWLVVTNYCNIS